MRLKKLLVLLATGLIFLLCWTACGVGSGSGNIAGFSVQGATIDGTDILMIVDENTESVSLSQKVTCPSGYSWKLYFDKMGQVEIPTKIAAGLDGELSDGANEFYLMATSQDGAEVVVYNLNVFRKYKVDVLYFHNDECIYYEFIMSGEEFSPSYIPEIPGYTFIGWDVEKILLLDELDVNAIAVPNEYTISYDVNGGEAISATKKVTYDSGYVLPKPTRSEYVFLGWSYNGVLLTDENGVSKEPWGIAKDVTLMAEWRSLFDEIMAPFIYTSTEDGCEITGLKDTTVAKVVIPNCVTSIGERAFFGCSSLASVVIPDSVTSIGYGAFYNCSSLTSVVIPDSVTSIGGRAFVVCSSLTDIAVNENNTAYKDIDGNLYTKDGATLIQYAIGKTATEFVIPDSVTSIGSGAFERCISLTSVVIGDSVTSIGDEAFYRCSSLTSVVIPDSVTSIGDEAFWGCSNLTSVEIPDSVTSIGKWTFYGSMTIYCEAESQPEGWDADWILFSGPVVWGYKGE